MSKKVKPLVLTLETAREQAEYFFKREFNTVSSELVKSEEGFFNITNPSDKVIINQYFEDAGSISAMFEEYRNESCDESFDEDNWQDDEAFIEYVMGFLSLNNRRLIRHLRMRSISCAPCP